MNLIKAMKLESLGYDAYAIELSKEEIMLLNKLQDQLKKNFDTFLYKYSYIDNTHWMCVELPNGGSYTITEKGDKSESSIPDSFVIKI